MEVNRLASALLSPSKAAHLSTATGQWLLEASSDVEKDRIALKNGHRSAHTFGDGPFQLFSQHDMQTLLLEPSEICLAEKMFSANLTIPLE